LATPWGKLPPLLRPSTDFGERLEAHAMAMLAKRDIAGALRWFRQAVVVMPRSCRAMMRFGAFSSNQVVITSRTIYISEFLSSSQRTQTRWRRCNGPTFIPRTGWTRCPRPENSSSLLPTGREIKPCSPGCNLNPVPGRWRAPQWNARSPSLPMTVGPNHGGIGILHGWRVRIRGKIL
jgi:hypothetical protein